MAKTAVGGFSGDGPRRFLEFLLLAGSVGLLPGAWKKPVSTALGLVLIADLLGLWS